MNGLLPADFSIADGAAILWLVAVWVVYGRFADRLPPDDRRPRHLNEAMHQIRRVWMRRMLDRHDRIVDSSLTGHTVNSIGFFASASMIVIAGLLGLLGKIGDAQGVIDTWGFAVRTSQGLFQLKMLGLVAIFILAFYKFTWALRQYNFTCALIGAAPLPPLPPAARTAYADQAARVLSLGVASFNGGIRAFYFAIAWLGWLIHPWCFIAATTGMALILLRRQLRSPSQAAVMAYQEIFGGDPL